MLIEQPCKKNIRNMAKISLKPHLKLFYFHDFTVVVFCSMYRFLCHCHIWINQKWIKCLVKLHRWQKHFRECKAQLPSWSFIEPFWNWDSSPTNFFSSIYINTILLDKKAEKGSNEKRINKVISRLTFSLFVLFSEPPDSKVVDVIPEPH